MSYNPYAAPRSQPHFVSPEHADTTARIHAILAVLYGVIGVVIVTLIALGSHDDGLGVSALVALFALVPALIHGTLFHGARHRREWAKNGSRAVAVLMLLGFPIGTLIGIYLLVQTSKPWPAPRG